MGQAGQHVEGGGQHRGVRGDPEWALDGHFLVDLVPSGDLVIEPLCHQILRGESVTID